MMTPHAIPIWVAAALALAFAMAALLFYNARTMAGLKRDARAVLSGLSDGIIILSQYNQLIDQGMERAAAILRTGELQLRPVLMTCVVAGVGLLPAALSTGIGSQVQKPLAVVVVSGMMLAPIVILVTLPALISLFSRRTRTGLAAEGHPVSAE